MFSPNTVYFGKAGKSHIDCVSRGQAELLVCLANLGMSGEVKLPADFGPCLKLLDRVNRRIEGARARFKELSESRTGDERVQQQLMGVLERWFVLGREIPKPGALVETDETDTNTFNHCKIRSFSAPLKRLKLPGRSTSNALPAPSRSYTRPADRRHAVTARGSACRSNC
jgi:cob(I)alamin adenosyltransferase